MAGWFFPVVGGLLIAFAVAFHTESEVTAWFVSVLGAATIAFGIVAPHELRVSFIETMLIVFVSLG
jgi:hypothetical protein